MEFIRINGKNTEYKILNIQTLQDETLQIVFADTVPDMFGDIEVFTGSGTKYADVVGYENVLSNSEGMVLLAKVDYVPPEEEELAPTAEEDLMAMMIDHEYRITLMELGVI